MSKIGSLIFDLELKQRGVPDDSGRGTLGWPINKIQDKAEILIYEDIGGGWMEGLTARAFIDQLNALGDVKQLDVRINSVGGSIFDASAIYNALERHPATKTVYIDGIAASAASWIAMVAAPGRLFIAENGRVMIHKSWTIEMGDDEAFRATADRLKQSDGIVADMYMKRATVSRERIVEMMAAETWFTASEAVDVGLADAIVGIKLADAANKLDLTKFRNVPQELVARTGGTGDAQQHDEEIAFEIASRWSEIRGDGADLHDRRAA